MNIAFIYEDNENSKLGKLLSSSYNKDNLYFARSNTRIPKVIKSIYTNYDCIVVFIDIVPNNNELYENLKRMFNKLVDLIDILN